MIPAQIINNTYQATPSGSSNFLNYLPAISFGFVVISYFIEKVISARSKKKQILREWYSHSLLEPTLTPINDLFEAIKELMYKHVAVFEAKFKALNAQEFLLYKAQINIEFQRLKDEFYTEHLVPIYHNYPALAEDANSFLLQVQDTFIDFFGGNALDKDGYYQFINDLYIEKGKLLATLRKPLYYSTFRFYMERHPIFFKWFI